MAFNVGAIVGDIRLNVRGFEQDFDRAQEKTKVSTLAMGNFLGGLALKAVTAIRNAVQSVAGGITDFIQEGIGAVQRYEAAMQGLVNVGTKLGNQTFELEAAIEGLTKDGLLKVGDAATGLKNLLSAGFGLEEATQIMNTFKDSAAFGRQSALSFGEAVVSATEGVKNQNSILVDNAGITKNLSIILKEQGFALQDLSDSSKGAAARQALLNGLMEEGKLFAGDAAKVSETLAGKQALLDQKMDKLSRTVGEFFVPVLEKLLGFVTPLIDRTVEWIEAHRPEVVEVFSKVTEFLVSILARGVVVVATIRERFEIWLGVLRKIQAIISAVIFTLVDLFNRFTPLGIILRAVSDDFDAFSEVVTQAAQDAAHDVAQADEDIRSSKERLRELEVSVQREIAEATGKTTEELFGQAAAIRAVRLERERFGPASIGQGGNVVVIQNNFPATLTGRESIPDFLDEQMSRFDSNQGGGRAGDETPGPQ